jgi:hypothetical protein
VGEVLPRFPLGRQNQLAGQVTDAAAQTGGGAQKIQQDPDGGRLPGPVRADETEHLTRLDGQRHPGQCPGLAVVLDQIFRPERKLTAHSAASCSLV